MEYRKLAPITFKLLNGKKIRLGAGGYYASSGHEKLIYIYTCIVFNKRLKRTLKIDKQIVIQCTTESR